MPLPPMFTVLLGFADQALDAMQRSYLDHGHSDGVPEESQYLVKRVCEDLRSALDWLATAIWVVQGKHGKRSPYFPIAVDRPAFDKAVRRDFPGLDTGHPELWRVIESHQPYHTHCGLLTYLPEPANTNKHQRFMTQARVEGGHQQLFVGGMGVSSVGLDGVILGAALPPDLPAGDSIRITSADGLIETIITPAYQWRFESPDLPVLSTLRELRRIVGDLLTEAGPHL